MRKYVIGVIVGLAGAMAFASVASAAVTALNIGANITPTKQNKKVRGGVSVFYESNDAHAGDLLGQGGCLAGNNVACLAYPPSVSDVITFPPDLKFNPGKLVDCRLTAIQGQSAAGARAACSKSVVGTGRVVNKTLSGQTLTGVVTAFNGSPSGGNPSMYVHTDIAGVTTKPILNGVIRGNTVTLQIPPVPGAVIEHIDVSFPKKVTQKKRNKRTGKVTKTFYQSIKCSKRSWTVTSTNTYQNGQTLTDSKTYRCTQKK